MSDRLLPPHALTDAHSRSLSVVNKSINTVCPLRCPNGSPGKMLTRNVLSYTNLIIVKEDIGHIIKVGA